MRVIAAGKPVTEADVKALEATLGRQLPTDYRDFLLAHNAQQIRPCVLPTPGFSGSEKVAIHELTCFCPNTAVDFSYRLSIYSDRVPNGFLPIGSDPGGNLFLLDLNPSSSGQVSFWERAYEVEEGEEPTMENVHKVAQTFTDFLSQLEDS